MNKTYNYKKKKKTLLYTEPPQRKEREKNIPSKMPNKS